MTKITVSVGSVIITLSILLLIFINLQCRPRLDNADCGISPGSAKTFTLSDAWVTVFRIIPLI